MSATKRNPQLPPSVQLSVRREIDRSVLFELMFPNTKPGRRINIMADELHLAGVIERMMSINYYQWRPRGTFGDRKHSRALSADQVADFLGITREEVMRIRDKYRGITWTFDDAVKRFAEWFIAHDRFPGYAELGPRNNLPTIRKLEKAVRNDRTTWLYIERSDAMLTTIRATWERKLLPAEKVLKIRNITWRRAAIAAYGMGEIVKGGELVDDDPVHGKLWKLPVLEEGVSDQHAMFLEVLNSSPEPDGSFATYHLRVPPNMTSAQRARAWTFNIDSHEFMLAQET